MSRNSTVRSRLALREEEANKIFAGVGDPVAKNLIGLCLAEARMRLVRWKGLTDEEWEGQLPVAPFDFEFFTSVLHKVLSNRETVERVMRGEDIESAAGWSVERWVHVTKRDEVNPRESGIVRNQGTD